MKLAEFAGYGDKLEQLMRSVQAGRIVHALLFTGPGGSGKRTIARLFAQSMVCTAADKPCGLCPACKRFLAGSHPDVHVIRPEKKTIGISVIRELIDDLALRPYEGGRHIVLIEQAETMTPQAQNALLKTLESPAGEAMFFLISNAPGGLLPTIVSRCQTVRFSDLSVEECTRVLVLRGIRPDRAAMLSGMAQGSVGRALQIDGDEAWLSLRERVITALEGLRRCEDVAGAAMPLEEEKGQGKDILDILEVWARDLMALQNGAVPYQSHEVTRLQRCRIDGNRLLRGVVEARKQLAGNVAWNHILETLFLKLTQTGNGGRIKLSWQQ